MTNEEKIKEMVKQKYSEIALQDKTSGACSCCETGSCDTEVYNMMSGEYGDLAGYNPEADLGLGCGLPTKFAQIKKGDTVVDLGSGAGNDCFVARAETGESGKVIGIDFTPAMIEKARNNAEKRGYDNVEFRQGDIEKIPVADDVADVIVSNCVLNLVPDKQTVFNEIYRVLKAGGHFSISDIVLTDRLPEKIQSAAEMYAGCVSGAIPKDEYIAHIKQAGFQDIIIQKSHPVMIPDEIMGNYMTKEELAIYKTKPTIWSITVYAEKKQVDNMNRKSFLELAKSRYSVRNYQDRAVETEKLTALLEAGRIAPTAANRQPCVFLVLNDRTTLEKLTHACNPHGAPLAIVVCADKTTAWVRPYDRKSMVEVDSTIAADHIMMCAQDLELSSCWITYFDPAVLRKEFNIPDNLVPVNILAIGYANDKSQSSDRHAQTRKPLDSMVKYASF